MANKYKVRRGNIVADEDGVGGGLVDMVSGCKGFVNNSRALLGENYANLKTQAYYKFAEMVNKGEVYINADMTIKDYIVQELEVVEMKDMDKDNKLQIIGKDKIKSNIGRSPDFSDALMMRMYFDIKKTTKITYYG
jgi:phage terminase large subunit